MSVHTHGGTMSGGVTPICDSCGVSLCWDISRTEYLEAKPFWDAWRCQDCNGSRLSAFAWRQEHGREALPAAVEAVVAAFEDAHPEYADATAAAGRSLEASTAFAAALDAAGFGTSVESVADVRGEPHHVVRLGAMTIDWTAVAHDEDAPTPLVFRTAHGWPIEPAPERSLDDMLAALSPDQVEILLERMAARLKAA